MFDVALDNGILSVNYCLVDGPIVSISSSHSQRRLTTPFSEQPDLVEFMRSQRELPSPGDKHKNLSASSLFRSRARDWDQAKAYLISQMV
jgi:hypothetical protein